MKVNEIQQQDAISILSDKHALFAEQAPDCPAWIDTKHEKVPKVFKDYEYPVSSWPVIIDPKTANTLSRMSVRLPQLIAQIPELYFGGDVKKIADFYLDGNEMLAQFALLCHNKHIEGGCRLDSTYTPDGFKVLEANIGSSIGGWQVQSFESIIRELHAPLSNPDTAHQFRIKNTQLIYVEFLVRKILEYVPGVDKEVNVFLVGLTNELGEQAMKDSITFFNDMLVAELAKRNLTGQTFSGDIAGLKLTADGLQLDEIPIHSVIILNLNAREMVPPDLFRAFVMDKIYLPDHLGVPMLGDKRNLGLLRELAEKGVLTPEDRKLVMDCIPWTATFRKGEVIYKGETQDLFPLLENNKDQFVIKPANGFRGTDVFVGKYLSQEVWKNAIHNAATENEYIAQEFCDSVDFLAPNSEKNWTPHKLIWGSFGYGDTYGGVWVRQSSTKTDTGVINSATGAVEAIVYESIV
ncbi:MAG: hypothetical protein AAF489_11870 [Bacteroidota bacterium]